MKKETKDYIKGFVGGALMPCGISAYALGLANFSNGYVAIPLIAGSIVALTASYKSKCNAGYEKTITDSGEIRYEYNKNKYKGWDVGAHMGIIPIPIAAIAYASPEAAIKVTTAIACGAGIAIGAPKLWDKAKQIIANRKLQNQR